LEARNVGLQDPRFFIFLIIDEEGRITIETTVPSSPRPTGAAVPIPIYEGVHVKSKREHFKLGLLGLTVAVALPTAILGVGPASADYGPQPGDVVGVGGDTPQYALQFGADGDTLGDAGFNSSGAFNRLVTFNATADGNARSAYTNSVTTGTPSVALNPTDVLRAGTVPVQRVQSSGAAIAALLADTSSPATINFVFSASLPTSANQATAASNNWGFLHVVEIGTDSVQIAADSTATNAPAGLSAADLLGIYTGTITKWNQLTGNSGGSADTIVPLIPPSGSSIFKTFIADLTTANNGTAPVLSASVKTVEQNDPTAITGASASADAIVPFSAARLTLWNSGYFHNPATVFPGSPTALTAGVKLLSGASGDGTAYSSPITDYVIFRQIDAASTTPFEPGGSRNWVNTLFSGSTAFFAKSAGQALIAASGVAPHYVDLGDVHS
jgi:ABC-type phosphate transport system substrate-binding protein